MFAVSSWQQVRPRTTLARGAFLAIAVVWGPLSLCGELGDGQPTDEAGQSAQAPATNPFGPDVIHRANALVEAGNVVGAIALLRDYAPRNPTMRSIKRMTLGMAYIHAEDWESALAQYAGVVEAPGGLPPDMVAAASLGAGDSCMRLGRYEDAVTHLEAWKRVVVEPQIGPYYWLSRAYKALGRYALAIESLEVVLPLAEEKALTSEDYAQLVKKSHDDLVELRRLAAEQQ